MSVLARSILMMGLFASLGSGGSYVFTTIVDPGAPGFNTYVSGINNAGQIVGGSDRGFVDTGGVFSAIYDNTLNTNIFNPFFGYYFSPGGINNQGQIVGKVFEDSLNATLYAPAGVFVYDAGSFTYPEVGGDLGSCCGINDAGQIVGTAYGGPPLPGAFGPVSLQEGFMIGGVFTPPPGTFTSSLTGINNAGTIVGNYGLLYEYDLPRLFIQTGQNVTEINDAAANPGTATLAAINNAGQIWATTRMPPECSTGSFTAEASSLRLTTRGATSETEPGLNAPSPGPVSRGSTIRGKSSAIPFLSTEAYDHSWQRRQPPMLRLRVNSLPPSPDRRSN